MQSLSKSSNIRPKNSNCPKGPVIEFAKPTTIKKIKLKGGSSGENIETNDNYLDKTVYSNQINGTSNATFV